MKYWRVYSFCLLFFASKSQDKIYFLDGSDRTVKVLEVNPDQIKIQSGNNEEEYLWRGNVLCIEYKNGYVEKITSPRENLVYRPGVDESGEAKPKDDNNELAANNNVSLNTLALCNSDISVFYERLFAQGNVGLGLLGAYNFNPYANLANAYIAILSSGKKNYDLGAFANFYVGKEKGKKNYFYLGLMFKYTGLRFISTDVDSVKIGNHYSVTTDYQSAKGSQFATLLTFGTHTSLSKNIFISTIFGLGGFHMRGDYLKEYNKESLQNNSKATPRTERTIFLKAYLGINIGYNF